MSLIDELREKSNKLESTKNDIIAEIKNDFDKYLFSSEFEDYLRSRIGKEEALKRKVGINVEFWAYHSGCSTTHFSCGGYTWYNPENPNDWESHDYKGFALVNFQNDICGYMAAQLRVRMSELGFHQVDNENLSGRLNYYHMYFYYGW